MTSPVIVVKGFTNGQTTNVIISNGFVIPEATAIDDVDGSVAVITNDGSLDNDVNNTYTVTYTAEDSNGNSSTFTLIIVVESNYDVNGFHKETGIHRNVAKILPSDLIANDQFGWSIAMDGNYAIISSQFDDISGSGSRSAYIFNYNDTNWIQQTKLIPITSDEEDDFGRSVSIDGDYAIVGANQDDTNGPNSGAAYIFKRSGINWSQQAKLAASDGIKNDLFGWSVSISGDYAIVGMDLENSRGAIDKDSAYIFVRNGTSWSEQAKLIASNRTVGDRFGRSVAIDGDYAIVGAIFDNTFRSESGSVYIFKRTGINWTQQAKLIASDTIHGDWFGWSVAIDGDYAIVGAYLSDNNRGSAYIFKRDNINWNQQVKLTPNDGNIQNRFGISVALDKDYVIVGATFDVHNSDAVYIFRRNETNWSEEVKLTANDRNRGDKFGWSVAIDSNYALVGAYGDDDSGSSSGSAYFYQLRR